MGKMEFSKSCLLLFCALSIHPLLNPNLENFPLISHSQCLLSDPNALTIHRGKQHQDEEIGTLPPM
jgi:hypothetical protein